MSSIVRAPSPMSRRSSSASTARRVSAMLSPVSPSATGKTLRSLTSWRRDSRWASAPATAARNRTRLVSVTATRLSARGAGGGETDGFCGAFQPPYRRRTSLYPSRALSSHLACRPDRRLTGGQAVISVGVVTGRHQVRITVCGIVILVIALASIFEPPGTTEAIGYAVVLIVMLFLIRREMRGEGNRLRT